MSVDRLESSCCVATPIVFTGYEISDLNHVDARFVGNVRNDISNIPHIGKTGFVYPCYNN